MNELEEIKEISASISGEEAITELSRYIDSADNAIGNEELGNDAMRAVLRYYAQVRYLQLRISQIG